MARSLRAMLLFLLMAAGLYAGLCLLMFLTHRGSPRVVILEGARHNEIDGDPRYLDAVATFLGR